MSRNFFAKLERLMAEHLRKFGKEGKDAGVPHRVHGRATLIQKLLRWRGADPNCRPFRVLPIGLRFCSTLASDPAARRRRCASLTLRQHQAG
jgi:hypothetical protein